MPAHKKETVTSGYGVRYRNDPEFREKCLQRLKEKVKCEVCGSTVTKANIYRHKQSRKHIRALEKLDPQEPELGEPSVMALGEPSVMAHQHREPSQMVADLKGTLEELKKKVAALERAIKPSQEAV